MSTNTNTNTNTSDTILKVALPIFTASILALGGWVWSTSTALTLTQADISYMKKEMEETKKKSSDLVEKVDANRIVLAELQRDLKYIKISVSNIEEAVENKRLKEK